MGSGGIAAQSVVRSCEEGLHRGTTLVMSPSYRESSANAATSGLKMALSIDHREKELIKHLHSLSPHVAALPVGDAVCRYDDGRAWAAERKTADDLAKSIIDGRWADQTSRLLRSDFSNVFWVVEGDLSSTSLPHETLLAACVNAELRSGSHVIRSACVEETAMVIQLLRKCAANSPGIPSGIKPKSKRVRDSETVWIRQLMCIPSISERIARLLLEHFGTLRELREALGDMNSFPRVRLDARTCIGKARLQLLARYLA